MVVTSAAVGAVGAATAPDQRGAAEAVASTRTTPADGRGGSIAVRAPVTGTLEPGTVPVATSPRPSLRLRRPPLDREPAAKPGGRVRRHSGGAAPSGGRDRESGDPDHDAAHAASVSRQGRGCAGDGARPVPDPAASGRIRTVSALAPSGDVVGSEPAADGPAWPGASSGPSG